MSDYFEARGVSSETYENFILPSYFDFVLKDLESGARILDFGCGFGQVLGAIKRKYGGGGIDSTESNSAKPSDESKKDFNLYGIDINQNAIECVKKLGIEVETINNIFDFKPSKKFDLIIATHVIEHLPKEQVIPTLRYFRESALSKNGRIFIAVPNASSNTGAYWAYEDWTHNCLFTAGSLIYVLKMAGFKNVEIVDSEAIMGSRGIKKLIRKFFLKIYRSKIAFWNRMTNSAFHAPSPLVFSYEVKALASN